MPFLWRDVAQLGSALRSGRRGRWFESSHPDFVVERQIICQLLSYGLNVAEFLGLHKARDRC